MENMTEMKFCQSCGMPLSEEVYGTEADGQKSDAYCSYCYADGKFLYDCTMEEMINFCVGPMVENNPEMTEEAARQSMMEFFPKLRRWQA